MFDGTTENVKIMRPLRGLRCTQYAIRWDKQPYRSTLRSDAAALVLQHKEESGKSLYRYGYFGVFCHTLLIPFRHESGRNSRTNI